MTARRKTPNPAYRARRRAAEQTSRMLRLYRDGLALALPKATHPESGWRFDSLISSPAEEASFWDSLMAAMRRVRGGPRS